MKRIQRCKKVNRNNNTFNQLTRKASHLNAVCPEILVGQIWLQEDEPTAVEIIELNTSDELDASADEAHDNHLDHAWIYAHNENLQHIEDNYKINVKAREKRRMSHENHFLSTNTSTNTNKHFINNKNYYSDIAGNNNVDSKLLNHQVNCFTIINNHLNSETSSDGEFADVEIITSNDIVKDPYNEGIITYDPELDKETRTIWIYSFKNKHLLTEDDYEFANIADTETPSCSTSSSTDSNVEQTEDKSTNVRRIGSPIPPTYIPRLNLSLGQTLSTVTEVSETNKQPSSNESYKSPKSKFQKPRNGWFTNKSDDKVDSARSVCKLEKSTNIVNWTEISPRERRRRSQEQGDKWEGSLLKLETLPTEELLENNQQQIIDKLWQNNASKLQVDVDVHVSANEKSPDNTSFGTPNSADVIVKSNADDIRPINKLKHAEVDLKTCIQDRGDHDNMKFEQTQQVLCVTPVVGAPLFVYYEPIKIDSAIWNREEREEKQTATYDFLTDKLECEEENGSDVLWMKNNAPLLKPSEWEEYAPITESRLSINLSINTSAEERKPWYKRFIKYIICCK